MCYLLYQACCERLGIETTDFVTAHKLSNTANPIAKMPFGKHKGEAIKTLPIGYVKWLLANVGGMKPSLYSALQKRLQQAEADANTDTD
jgi:exodeoxyribonuclease X